MGSYYYAVASLPYLTFETEDVPGREEFLEICRQWGTESDLEILSRITLEPDAPGLHPILDRYQRFETGLRNELVKQRSQHLQRDPQDYIHSDKTGDDHTAVSGLSEQVRAAVQAPTPLKADEILDRLRWQFLDELEIGQFFNVQQMIVYYLRLQILLRRNSLTKETGREEFDGHYQKVRSQMQEIQNDNGVQA